VLNDPDKVRLSAFLGMDILEEIDYNRKPLRLRDGDVLLLCSDGISGVLQESEIMEALAFPPPEACARLNDAVARRGNPKQDNYTGLIIASKQ
jgi:protein phosphatase